MWSLSSSMNARTFRYMSNAAWSPSESLNMLEISEYMHKDTHCLLRGGPGGRFQGRGQLRSGDKCWLYVYEWSKESKDCACLAIDTLDVPTFPVVMKEDISVGVSKPKKKKKLEPLGGWRRRKNRNNRFVELAFTVYGIFGFNAFCNVTVCIGWLTSSVVVSHLGLWWRAMAMCQFWWGAMAMCRSWRGAMCWFGSGAMCQFRSGNRMGPVPWCSSMTTKPIVVGFRPRTAIWVFLAGWPTWHAWIWVASSRQEKRGQVIFKF